MSVGEIIDSFDGFQYRIVRERTYDPPFTDYRKNCVGIVYMRRTTSDQLYFADRYSDGRLGLPAISHFHSHLDVKS